MGVVFDKAETAGGLLETVKTHDQALDLAALGEELVDLFFGRVEGEVADVEGSCVLEFVFGLGSLFLGSVVIGGALVSATVLQAS